MDGIMETSLPDLAGASGQESDQFGPGARKRVSQACKPCGIKKVKCDGLLPACTSCRNRGVECEYGESKRRNRHRIHDGPYPRPGLSHPPFFTRDEVPRLTSPNHDYSGNQMDLRKSQKLGGFISNVPADLSTRLFQNYFNYIHPLWPILYKPLYAALDYGNPTQMMPPALVAAIFTIASCIDRPQKPASNITLQRPSDPETYFSETMELMQYDDVNEIWQTSVGSASITNCQALTILALQQHGVAEYARAAMLCSLASTMAFELRLHRPDMSKDAIQGEVRTRLWWNLFILEKMMSCEMGRPVLLRAEETDCGIPSVSEADEFELMTTFTRDGSTRNTSIKLRTLSGLHTSIRLSIIMERISREVYGLTARKSIRADQQYGEAKRMELWNDLQTWESSIAESPLRLDLSDELTSIPAAITNFVVMWSATILLHRPFIARWVNGRSDASTNPLDICLRAANEICLILEKYFDRLPGLPCDMVFSVFTAASTFLHHSKQPSNDDGFETRRKLKLCIHWLSVWGKSWKSAGAHHKLLNDMYDLPSDLKTNGQTIANNPPPYNQVTSPLQSPGPTPFTAINGTQQIPLLQVSQQPPQAPELVDWAFLNNFGDSTDDFFALDVDFRSLLKRDFASGSSRFI